MTQECKYKRGGDCTKPCGKRTSFRCPTATMLQLRIKKFVKKEMEEEGGTFTKVWDKPAGKYSVRMVMGNGNTKLICKTRPDVFPKGKFAKGELRVVIDTGTIEGTRVMNVVEIAKIKRGDFKGYWRVVVR